MRGTDSTGRGPVMSLTDAVLSLFLFQAAVAAVQFFPDRGSDQGLWALHAPSPVFMLHPFSIVELSLKQPQMIKVS